jgi:hypothetical protein
MGRLEHDECENGSGAVKPLASQEKLFSYSNDRFHHNLEIIERSTA